MNQVIRPNVFETNSSSTHSISLSTNKDTLVDKIPLDSDGTVTIYPGEFGWGYDSYRDASTKASYCYTHALSLSDPEKDQYINQLREVISNHLKIDPEFVKFDHANRYNPDGHIDHQSSDVPADMFTDNNTLTNFIFNRGSVLIIDNDNH